MRVRKRVLSAAAMVIAGAAIAGCGVSDGAKSNGLGDGHTYTIKFTSTQQPDTPNGELQYKFAKLVEKESHGRIKVSVYPNSLLGSEDELVPQVVDGATQMTELFAPQMAQFVSNYNFFQVPMVFNSQAAVVKGLNSPAMHALDAAFLNKTGVRVLGWGSLGFVQLLSKHPVTSVEAMKGLKVRIAPGSEPLVKSLPLVGAEPVPLAEGDDFTSEQSGLVNAIVNPSYTFVAGKDYENLKYLTNLDFQYNPNVILINNQFFAALPPDLKKIVQSAATTTTRQEIAAVNKASAQASGQLEKLGVKVTTFSAAQRSQLATKVQPYLKSAVGSYGADLFKAFGIDTSRF
jgi:TRAP-type C4-dicarboxylate transport system substrate-binding protein